MNRRTMTTNVSKLLTLTIALTFSTISRAEQPKDAPLTRDKWNVAIVIHEKVELLDFAGPGEVFASAGVDRAFRVYTVGETVRPIRSQGFLTITPQYSIANCPKPDILVIPGGETTVLLKSPEMMKWLGATAKNVDITFSVCTGAFVLADLGLLDGKEATTHHSSISGLKGYPRIKVRTDRRVVDNGKIVTAAGVSAGIDGALHIVARLCGEETATRTAKYMEYRWQPEPSAEPAQPSPAATTTELAWFAGNWENAAKGYSELVAKQPNDGVAQYRLGFCHLRLKRYAEGVACLERAIQEGYRAGPVYGQLGFANMQLRKPAEAAKYYEQALAQGVREWAVYYELARAYAQIKESDKALTALEQAYGDALMSDIDGALVQADFDSLRSDARFGAIFRKHVYGSKTTLTKPDEPGEPLESHGVVRGKDGQPVAGALVYVYHTDARGYYSAESAGRGPNPRLFAYLRTDAEGRYEFRSIRPAGYPDSKIPQHIHYEVTTPGCKKHIGEMLFADDPRLVGTEREKAEESRAVATVTRRQNGVQSCAHDVVLERD